MSIIPRKFRGSERIGRFNKTVSTDGGGGASYFLDTYTTAFDAWEVARITKTGQTQIVEVREDGGGTFAWIGPDANGDLDESAATTHTGANNGYVRSLMGGNGNAATQTTAANQFRVVSAGVVDKENGKPCLRRVSGLEWMETATWTAESQPNTLVSVGTFKSGAVSWLADGDGLRMLHTGSEFRGAAGATLAAADTAGTQKLYAFLANGASSIIRINGSEANTGDAGSNTLTRVEFGNNGGTNQACEAWQSAAVFYDDQTTNFAAIETYYNDYYGMYV